jgi:exo-beta-1,3-glucanase (GH17 family)
MVRSRLLCALLVAAVCAALWRFSGSPSTDPPAPTILAGLSFSPLDRGQRPERSLPSIEALDADLVLVAAHTKRIRTYAIDGALAEVPALAERHGLEVTLGVALDPRDWADSAATNAARLRRLVEIAGRSENVTRVIVGNESVLAGDWTVAELAAVLDQLRGARDPRRHGGAMERLGCQSVARPTCRLHCRALAALLGRHRCTRGGRARGRAHA